MTAVIQNNDLLIATDFILSVLKYSKRCVKTTCLVPRDQRYLMVVL